MNRGWSPVVGSYSRLSLDNRDYIAIQLWKPRDLTVGNCCQQCCICSLYRIRFCCYFYGLSNRCRLKCDCAESNFPGDIDFDARYFHSGKIGTFNLNIVGSGLKPGKGEKTTLTGGLGSCGSTALCR